MAIPKTISVQWLKSQEACKEDVELFERTFGERARITKRGLVAAAAAGLDLLWLAGHLGKDALAEYEYRRVTAQALWAALQIEWKGRCQR
jgi:hypothetical protein